MIELLGLAFLVFLFARAREGDKPKPEAEPENDDRTFICNKFRALEPYAKFIHCKSKVYRVPTWIVIAIIYHESGGLRTARGSSGEIGLMQVWPPTAEPYGYTPTDLLVPSSNIDCGTHYLADLHNQLEGEHDPNWGLSIRAYNVGPDLEPQERGLRYLAAVKAHKRTALLWWNYKGYDQTIGPMIGSRIE